MASAVMMRSYAKESVRGEYETGLLFEPGFLSDEHAGLGIATTMGPSVYAGATDGAYVAGDIKLYLKQHGDSRAIQNEWAISAGLRMGDSVGGGDVALGAVSAEEAGTYRDTRRQGTSMGRTGGKELLNLDFHRAYGFMVPVTYHLDGVREKRGKLRPNRVDQAGTTVGPRSMMYLLPEPKALAAYGRARSRSTPTRCGTPSGAGTRGSWAPWTSRWWSRCWTGCSSRSSRRRVTWTSRSCGRRSPGTGPGPGSTDWKRTCERSGGPRTTW